MRTRFFQVIVVTFVFAAAAGPQLRAAPHPDGELAIEVVDGKTGKPVAARMHLKNTRGRAVELRLPRTAEYGGHFYIDGQLTLPLRRGQYTFELDAGPEYRLQTGHFEVDRHADDSKRIEVSRFADLAKEGWYAGDTDVKRPDRDLPLILRGEKLSVVRNADSPDKSEIKIARTPYDWDLPAWLANDDLTAIQLIHHHALRDGVVANEKDGRPRDRALFPGKSGNARWSEAVYYHVLNCGLRIPPAAGSGSGTNDNPIGTNRVYVYCGDAYSDDAWWDGLKAGQVFVTNGPLLRPLVQRQPPGYVFHIDNGGSLTLDIGLNLATRVPIDYLEVIKNGKVEFDVRLADFKKRKGRLPPLTFDDSGWFLVRAVTNNPQTFQLASSGPYYVEKEGRPRISRTSVQFFLDWITAAEARVRELPNVDDAHRQSLLAQQASAREFFESLLARANDE